MNGRKVGEGGEEEWIIEGGRREEGREVEGSRRERDRREAEGEKD